MTILISCLIIAALLPYIAKVPLAYAMKQQGGYDNHQPRTQQSQLTGFGARALAAHQNAFESLIVFAPAVLLAIATQHTQSIVTQLAVTHIIARIVFHLCYLFNIALLRSLIWGVGMFCSLAIMFQCLP